MNKFFQKLAKLFLGLSMAAGVGVAIGANKVGSSRADATTADLSGWTKSGTGTYTDGSIKFDGSGDYIQKNSLFSGTISTITITVNCKSNGGPASGNVYTASILNSSGTAIANATKGGSDISTSYGNMVFSFTSGVSTGTGIKLTYTTKASGGGNWGIKSVDYEYSTGSTTFKVTYYGNGNTSGSVPTDATAYSSGATVTVKGNTGSLAKTGYTFGGWNTNTSGTGTNYVAGSGQFTISANTSLYAKWTANQYTITYYDEGGETFSGTFASTAPTTHTYGSDTALLSPTKEGYGFAGWFTTSACTGSAITTLSSTGYTANINLYAKWTDSLTYQHIFNAKPATGNSINLTGVNWNISASNLGGYNSGNYAGVQLGSSSSNGSITLTSANNWGEQSGSTYYGMKKITEVRLWLNRGGSSVTPSVTIGGKSATSDGTIVAKNSSAGSDWTKTTKVTFTPASDGTTGVIVIGVTSVNAGYICAVEIDCKPATFKVTYDGNGKTGGSVPTDDTAYANGATVTVKGNTGSLVKTGYSFGGWNENAQGTGTNYTAGSGTFTILSDKTLYAKWNATTYSISYNLNDGTHGSTHPTSGTYDTAFYVSAPTKTGYTFNGWTVTTGLDNTTAKWGTTSSPTTTITNSSTLCVNGTSNVYFKNINASSTAVVLTANWTINSYSVGGTITNGSLSSTASVNHGAELSITINADSGYKLPTTLTSVTMGGAAYAGYTYNSETGAFRIASVTGPVVINATCPINATTYTISGSITNGSLSGDTGEQVEADDYMVQITPNTLYKYPTTISIEGAGEEDTGWEYSSSDGIVYIYNLSGNVTINATCPAASITSISVTGQKTAFTLGDDFSFGGTVKANYDDAAGTTNQTISTDLVNIDSSAYNAFVEANNDQTTKYYTITVSLKSNASVNVSYNVTVTKKAVTYTTTWELVEEDLEDFSGEYVLLDSANAHYPTTSIDGSGRAVNGTAPTVTNKVISNDNVTNAMIWIINKEGDFETEGDDPETVNYYSIKNKADNKYMISASTKKLSFPTSLSDPENDYELWQIAYGSALDIYNQGLESDYYLRNNGTYGWRCYGSGTGTKPLLYKKVSTPSVEKSFIQLTATGPADNVKFENESLSVSDFVATAHFDTGSDDDEVVTPTIVSGPAKLVQGENTFVLSYTYGAVTKQCSVVVVAAEQTAELDGIEWSQEGITRTIIEGTLIGSFGTISEHYDDDSTIPLTIGDCSVAVYNNTSGSKAHDIADPATYTWSLTNDNGKYLGITYEGYTLYSGVVTVVEHLNSITGYTFKDKSATWTLSQTQATKSEGVHDDPIDVDIDTNIHMLGGGSGTKTRAWSDGMRFYNGSTITFTPSNGAKIKSIVLNSSGKTCSVAATEDNGTYTITTPTAEAITFSGWTSGQTITANIVVNYEIKEENDNIANTNAVVQKEVLDFVTTMNSDLAVCGTTGLTSSVWTSLSGKYTTAKNSSTDSELFENMFKFATSTTRASDGSASTGDTLQNALARYDYIISTYGTNTYSDFLGRVSAGSVVSGSRFNIGLLFTSNNTNTVAIIVIISMVSVTAIGGYFFLRKRKEN